MAENIMEPPITPGSLPNQSGELIYGPDLVPQPGFPKADWDPNAYHFESNIPANADPFANLYKGFDDSFYKRAQKKDYFEMGAATPFNAESTLFDKFESSWDFSTKGFVPWRDNDDTYNQDTNVLKELYRSTKWAAPLFGEGFVSGLRTFPDLIGGIFNGDLDQIIQSDDQLADKWARATKMGGSTAGGMSSFLTNFEISAANMLGLVTETIMEDALIGAVTVFSGGATTPLAVAEAGKTASVFKNIYQGFKNLSKLTDIFKEAKNARRLWEITEGGLKTFGTKTINFLNPLEQSLKFGKDLLRGEEYLKNSSNLGKAVHGFGSFYRDLREVNFALTEAKLEGGFSYLERSNQMTNDYIAANGYAPQGKEAQDIEMNARAGGDFTTQLNVPIIYYSNRFGFGNLFKGYTPLNKLMTEASTGNSLFKNITFNSAKKLFEETKDFSVKRAFRRGVGSSLNYFKANYMEGIQENLQDVIQGAAADYYDKQFKNPSYGGTSVMLADIGSQFNKKVFTAQGAETFASGFLMGSVMQGGIRAKSGIQNLTYRLTDKAGYEEFKTKRSEQINKYVTQLNEMYQDPTKYLDPQLMNAVRQGELSKYLSQSVANSNKKEFYDIKDQAVYEHLWTMVRSGKSDVFRDRLEEFKQLEPEEFENALGFQVENPAEFKTYIDDQLKKLDQIQSMYDKANDNLKNPVNLGAFKKGTKAYEDAAAQYIAFENAKQQAVFANYSFMRNAERMKGLLEEMQKVKVIGKSNFMDLTLLSDPNLLEGEMNTLKKEIVSLSKGDAESQKLANEKLKRLKALEVWKGIMESGEIKGDTTETEGEGRFPKDYPSADNPAYENWRRAAKLAFENLVQVEAGTKKDFVYRQGVDDVFSMLMDYHTLGRESKGMMEVVNLLADPENFLKLYNGHFSVIQELRRKRIKTLFEAIQNALKVNDENGLINMLAFNNFVEDPDNPGTYFRITDMSPVEPDSEDAKKIQQIIEDYQAATKSTTQTAQSTAAAAPGDVNIMTTPSASIIAELNKLATFEEKLDWLKSKGLLAPISINGKEYNVVDYNDRVMVLMKIGQYNIPFYISTGQAGKKNVKAGDWYVVFGIGEERGWINKGTEKDINDQYNFPMFQKLARILNEGVGKIETRENNGNGKIKDGIGFLEHDPNDPKDVRAFNAQMNLPTQPAGRADDSTTFYNHVNSTLKLLNDELVKLQGAAATTQTATQTTATQTAVQIQETPEGDFMIDHEGVHYEVFKDDPSLFFTVNQAGELIAVESKDVPDVVKSELDKFIKAKTPSQQTSQQAAQATATKNQLQKEKTILTEFLAGKYGTAYGISTIGLLTDDTFDIVDGLTAVLKNVKVTREEQEEFINIDPNDRPAREAFFKKVAERRLKEVDEELAGKTKQQPAKSLLPEILNLLDQVDNAEDLLAFENYFDPKKKEYKAITDTERQTLVEAFTKKLAILTGEADLDENSPKFKQAYNKAIADVKAFVKKPGLTEDEVKSIFNDKFLPVIGMLKDKAVQAKYRAKLKAERDAVINKIRNNQRAKDVNALKIVINDIFKNNALLTDIENAALVVFSTIVSPDVKEQVIEHFAKMLEKKFEDEISKLEEAVGSIENDEVAKKYIDHLVAYKEKIEASLERFKKQAEEIKEKTQDISLAVDVDDYYENDTHASILTVDAFENMRATSPQRAALSNLITSGILLANEVSDNLSVHDASALINLGVARIYTLGINKGILTYLATGKLELLEKEYTDYLNAAKGDEKTSDIIDKVKKKIEKIKAGEQTAEAILEELDIPKTAEIGDAEFKLLRAFRTTVANVQTETSLLDAITGLKDKQQRFLSRGVIPSSLEELLDEDTVKVISRFLSKQKGVKFDIAPFYDDLLEVIEKIQSIKDVKEADKLVKELVRKYAPPAKAPDAGNLVKAFIGNVLETQGLLSGQIEVGEELTDDEIIRILNGEKRSLTPTQMRQVEAYEKEVIEQMKNKFSSAPGYKETLVEYDAEELALPAGQAGLKFLALRQKDAEDLRTTEDLMAEYEVVAGKMNIRKALQNIIDSDFATPAEKELAGILMQVVAADATMDVNNSLDAAGEWNPETERATINMSAVGYKEDFPSNPVETVILHELLHGQIERALQDPDGQFTKSMKSLFAAVKGDPRASSFYAMQSMNEDEQLREFVVEAFTNPAFQYLLASVPYAKSGKTVWQKFMDILSNLLKSVGINIEGTVLNEVINQTAELIKFDYSEKSLARLAEVKTLEEIAEFETEINKEGTILSPSILEGLNSALQSKRNSIIAKQLNEQTKGMKQIKIDGKTFYVSVADGKVQLFRKTNKKLLKVKKSEIIDQFIEKGLKDDGIQKFIGEDNVKVLQDLIAKLDAAEDKGPARNKLNRFTSGIFGLSALSITTQEKIENAVRNLTPTETEEETEVETEMDMEGEKEEFFADSTKPKPRDKKEPSEFDPAPTDPKNTITAVNTNALRSNPYDIYPSGEETPQFIEFYYKVREIINKLSLKDLSELGDIYITLDNDVEGLRWDGSAQSSGWVNATKGIVGYLSDKDGNPIIFDADGNFVGKLDRNNLADKKGLDNGANQIVYFTTFTEKSNTDASKLLTPETKAKLLESRKKVAEGTPQIAKLVRITQGEMNKKSLVKPNKAGQANTKNADFYGQITQPNISFEFNDKGDFIAVLTSEDGAINKFGLFPPNTRNVNWTNGKGNTTSLFDHLINVMVTLREMKLRGEDTGKLEDDLAIFVRNMWLTGENFTLQIPKNFERIRIKPEGAAGLMPMQIFNVRNGQIVLNQENIETARKFMNNLPVNISKAWWSGKTPFKFPRIVTENGVKVLKFAEMGYKDFMFKQIGLSSNVTEIPNIDQIKRYNSLIVFTETTDLAQKVTPAVVTTEDQMLDNQNAVKDQVDDAVKNSEDTSTVDQKEIDALKKKKRFKAPAYDQIFEKICK